MAPNTRVVMLAIWILPREAVKACIYSKNNINTVRYYLRTQPSTEVGVLWHILSSLSLFPPPPYGLYCRNHCRECEKYRKQLGRGVLLAGRSVTFTWLPDYCRLSVVMSVTCTTVEYRRALHDELRIQSPWHFRAHGVVRFYLDILFYLLQSKERKVLSEMWTKCYSIRDSLAHGVFPLLPDHRTHHKKFLELCEFW